MSNTVLRYSWVDGYNDTYQFELMIGDTTAITPSYVDLDDPAFVGCKISCEQDSYSGIRSVLGLPTANVLTLTLDINDFSNTLINQLYDGTNASSTTLTLYTGYTTGFRYENTIVLKKNGTPIFYGVQEIEDKVTTNSNGQFEIEFVCIISKALQILELSDEGLGLTDNSTIETEPTTLPNYDKICRTTYNYDFFYLVSSQVRGSQAKTAPLNQSAGHKFITFKYFFEVLSDLCSTLATAWRRGSTTITIDNPMTIHTFYKQDETSAGSTGSPLTEDELGFVYAIDDIGTGDNQTGLFVDTLKYESVWEFLRDMLEGWGFRSKYDYSALTLKHYPFKDTTNEVTINGNIGLQGDLTHNELKFTSINSTIKGNIDYNGPIGISKNEVKDVTVTYQTNNNGNLARFELYPIFHTSPVGVTDHRIAKWWGSKCYNHGAISYLRIVSYSGINRASILRAHDKIAYKYASASAYSPTPHAEVLKLPDASSAKNGDYVGKYMTNWVRKRLSNSTSPVITNYVLWTYLLSPSLSFEIKLDQGNFNIEDIGEVCTFSSLDFLPAYSNISEDIAFITKIEYDFEGFWTIGVTLAN